MQNTRRSARAGFLAGVLAYCCWGLIPLYWHLLAAATPTEILSHRIAWTFVFILAVLGFEGRLPELARTVRSLTGPDRRTGVILVLAAAFSSANWLVNIAGVNTGHVVELGIGMFLTPLLTVAIGVLAFRERLDRVQWAAVLLALFGLLVMIANFGSFPWFAVGVSSTWATYSALKKKVEISAWLSLAVEHGLMLLPALLYVFYLASSGEGHFLSGLGPRFDLALAAVGIVTAVPMIAFSFAAPRLPLVVLGFIQYINPILTITLGVLFFGESVTLSEAVPLVFIWSGIALYSWAGIRKANAIDRARRRGR